MFRKLVSNLPYSPQLIEQVGFYAQRLKQEEFSRRIGVVFALLGMVLQFFVFLAPPEASLATSTNDIVYGGIPGDNPKETMLRIYNDNFDTRNNDIQKIFNHFGIDADDIRNSTLTEISSKNRSLHSLGRENKHAEDKPVRIEDDTYYLRPLYVWDVINDYNVYDALKIPGRNVWILLSCGNIVVEKPTPDLSISKSGNPSPGNVVNPGDTIQYSMDLANSGQVGVNGLIVEDVMLVNNKPAVSALNITETDNSDAHDVVSSGPVPGFYDDIPHAYWLWHDYAANEQRTVQAEYVVPSTAKDGDIICNTAYIRSSGTQTKKSRSICHTVEVTAPPNPQLAINKSVSGGKYKIGDTFEYTVTVRNTGEVVLSNVVVNDSIPESLDLENGNDEINRTISNLGINQEESFSYSVKVRDDAQSTITNQACAQSESTESICDETTITVESDDTTTTAVLTPDISLSKGAKVVSAPEDDPRRQDAHKTTVGPNEVIEYRLLVSNTGDGEKEDFIVTEDLSDVLEYAEVVDNGGGTLKENGVLTWEPRTIAAGETIEHIFRVKVKSPVPSTPNSVSDPQSYDLIMDNIYGSTQVRINVKAPTQKVVENAVKELPKTGVGMNTILTILFTGTVGYFYSRNKQLIEEIRRLRSQYNNGVQYES